MKRYFSIIICLCLSLSMMAANRKTTVARVSTPVTLTENVDYQITNATPFADSGMVNIVNVEHAVLIFAQVKPSAVIRDWLSKVQINGEAAANNINCQVKLYNRGCIIMPYSRSIKPLTVYSEKRYEGESCNNFGTEQSHPFL